MNQKAVIRAETLNKRDSLDPEARRKKDLLIEEKILSLPEFNQAQVIFFFASFRSEVSTFKLIEETLSLGKNVLLPLVDTENKELRLFEIKDLNELSPGYMGIPEPAVPEGRERDINDVQMVVMPGAAFDISGNRLGYGAGYYDKLLSRLRRKVPFVALAYEDQIVDSIPSEAHDVCVQIIVTDKRIIRCRKR